MHPYNAMCACSAAAGTLAELRRCLRAKFLQRGLLGSLIKVCHRGVRGFATLHEKGSWIGAISTRLVMTLLV
jgi:hypothetical protein